MKKEDTGEYGCRANKINSELYDVAYISIIVKGKIFKVSIVRLYTHI